MNGAQDENTRADVYGETFASAKSQMDMIANAIQQIKEQGFDSPEACAAWAKDHFLDLLVYSSSQKCYFNLTHTGELVTLGHWKRTYSDDVLFFWSKNDKDPEKVERIPWWPKGFDYHSSARIMGEQTNGLRKPLSHRNFFQPTGYFDPISGTFNQAIPFTAYAKATGRDTSHIYTYIEHLAGRCAPYLLAWLRQKCMYPQLKTEVAPIISSRAQGTGKTTFADVICRALFGKENVYVSDKFDTNSKFNADYADKLVVCAEEKDETDKRVDASALKSMITATTVRKEYKGIDPIVQDSYTEFIVTTNKDVPIKCDTEDQRRFMIMDVDPGFRRLTQKDIEMGITETETNKLADEVFTKLYGKDKNRNPVGVGLVEDHDLIAQFKHELFTSQKLANINPRDFPRDTEAAQRCFSLPRTTENTEIDMILRNLAPFIKQSLLDKKVVVQVDALQLANFISTPAAFQYMPAFQGFPSYLAICRPLIFYDQQTNKPFNHATVERGILDCAPWLLAEYGIRVLPSQLPLPGGFMNVTSRYRAAPAARFALVDEMEKMLEPVKETVAPIKVAVVQEERIGQRLRVNSQWKPDVNGEYETVNEMKPGVNSLDKKNENVQYMDNFLFEADDVTKSIYTLEQTRLKGTSIKSATSVFMERLRTQKAEADRLLNEGIAWRVVYSGGKSYHVLVRIKDAPNTLDEYKWLHAHLCNGVISKILDYDPSCCDPARLTRAPIEHDRTFMYNGASIMGKQALYREMPGQVFDYNWRPLYAQWLQRPLEPYETNGKKLRPVKQEYRDAMWALLNGTFWTDSVWHGRRQQCFSQRIGYAGWLVIPMTNCGLIWAS